MKIVTFLMALITLGQFAQAEQISYVKYCSSKAVVVNIEVYDSGVVGWVVTDMLTGQNEQFMGYITAGDSKDLQNEFYSTDLGSDLHVKGKSGTVTLTRNGDHRYKLQCD